MLTNIRKYLHKEKRAQEKDHEAWNYYIQAERVRQDIKRDEEELKRKTAILKEYEEARDKAIEEIKGMEGEAYTKTRAYINDLTKDIEDLTEINTSMEKGGQNERTKIINDFIAKAIKYDIQIAVFEKDYTYGVVPLSVRRQSVQTLKIQGNLARVEADKIRKAQI